MVFPTHRAQVADYTLLAIVLLIAVLSSFFIGFSGYIAIAFIGLFVFFIAFINTDAALITLIFSMLLSPEFALGGIKGREVVIRFDDILLLVVFFGWIAKMAFNKELGVLRLTPLNRPIMLYVGICAVSSMLAVVSGKLAFKNSIFYFLKYFEYFLLFFLVVNNLRDLNQVKRLIGMMIFVAVCVSIFAWFLRFSGEARVTAPFEGKNGEPNTLGGYLVFMMMITTGLLANLPSENKKIYLLAALFFMFPALLFTLSRESWLGFIPSFLTLIILTRRGKHSLIIAGLMLVVLGLVAMPRDVTSRVSYTFQAQTERTVLGKKIKVDESTAARIDSWKEGTKMWLKAPFFGHGAGFATVIDNQYTRVLAETGLIGAIFFAMIIVTLVRFSWANLRMLEEDPFAHGIIVGFIAGLVGVMVHGVSAASFIIVRIMEPFWFFAAIVFILPDLINKEKYKVSDE